MMRNLARQRPLYLGFLALVVLSSCQTEKKGNIAANQVHVGDHLTSFSQEITSGVSEFHVKPGSIYTLEVDSKNTGTQPWFGGHGEAASVTVGYRWIDSQGVGVFGGNRALLKRPVIQPGESEHLQLQVIAPPSAGSYTLWVSMVQEGVDWFYARGGKPLVLHVTTG